jgi:hypothetical protein
MRSMMVSFSLFHPLSLFNGAIYKGLRVEWAKSKAHIDHWSEDVTLVVEEMCQVLVFMDWKAGWWAKLADAQTGVSMELEEGLRAYAAKQSAISKELVRCFADQWYAIHAAHNIEPEWPGEYLEGRMDTDISGVEIPSPEEVEDDADFFDNIFD